MSEDNKNKEQVTKNEDSLSKKELENVSGGMQWEYTKQDDTGTAKGTVTTKN